MKTENMLDEHRYKDSYGRIRVDSKIKRIGVL